MTSRQVGKIYIQIGRKAGRQADKQTDRQTGRQTDRQTGRQVGRYIDRHACMQVGWHTGRHMQAGTHAGTQAGRHRQTGRQTGRQAGRQTGRRANMQKDRQTGRQADRQTDTQTHHESHGHRYDGLGTQAIVLQIQTLRQLQVPEAVGGRRDPHFLARSLVRPLARLVVGQHLLWRPRPRDVSQVCRTKQGRCSGDSALLIPFTALFRPPTPPLSLSLKARRMDTRTKRHTRRHFLFKKKKKKRGGVPLVEFMYLAFTRMPDERYRRRLRSLLLFER